MILKGENIILRPLKMSDVPRFIKWLQDPTVNKFTLRRKVGLKEERKWIHGLKKDKNNLTFAIDTKNGIHIGSINLYLVKLDNNAIFDIFIGDKNYWDKGYGTNASKVIIDYGFRKLNLHKIFLDVYEYNKRAIRLYKKLGFKIEGAQRENILYNGKFYDKILMGILKKWWDISKIK